MKSLINIGAICLLACLAACSDASLEPKVRPAKVPGSAVWAGGADGGAYVRCSVDAKRNVDVCEVWNDNTGYSAGARDYQLEKEHRAATNSELKFSGAANDSIYLADGRVLVAIH
ncbi:MAG TPA: hypothetical protein VN734_16360 [Acidobacteriaceae bacterium]|nr:hypothetical protein [Acidobacteriaceae bacterium]